MVRKILLLAMVAFTLLVFGCEQEMPMPTVSPEPNKVSTNQPESTPEIPLPKIDPAPDKTPVQNPTTTVKPVIEKPPVITELEPPKSKTIEVKVYFPDDAGINLVAVKRQITFTNEADKYADTVKLLMTKPTETDLTGIFPKGAKLNSVEVRNGTAFVDFGNSITRNFVGGSTGEEMLVTSVVDTLTEFSEVKRVRFLIDGSEIETLAGHMDLSEPLTRDNL